MGRVYDSLIAACVVAALCWFPAPALSDTWTRVDTEHFTMVGDGSPREVSRTAAHLERFIDMLAQTTTTPNRRQAPPTWIILFSDQTEFIDVAVREENSGLTGYFLEGEYLNLITARLEGPSDPLEVLIHEYVHLFLRYNVGLLPVWLDEGLAECYSTFRTDGEKATIGTPIDYHLIELRTGRRIDLPDLLRTGRSSLDYHQLPAAGMFYAQSWLLAHFLFQDGGVQGRTLDDVLAQILHGKASSEALQAVLGDGYPDLDKTLERYAIRETFPTMVWTFDEQLSDRVGEARPISSVEKGVFMGELLARGSQPRVAEARSLFEAAIHGGGEAPVGTNGKPGGASQEARLALGRLELRDGKPASALEHLKAATAIDSLDAYAFALMGDAHAEAGDLEEAREAYRRAVSLRTDNSKYVLSLTETYFDQPESSWQVADLVNSAYANDSDNLDLFQALVGLNAAVGNGRGVAQALSSRPMPKGERRELERKTIPLFRSKVAQLFGDGKEDEARQLIDSLRQVATDSGVREWLDGLEEQLGFANRQNQWVDRYNEAIDLAQAANYDSAIVVWEEVAQRSGSRELRSNAQANIIRTRHILRFDEAQNAARDGDEPTALELASELLQDSELTPELRMGVLKLRDWLVAKKGSEQLWARFDEATALVRRGRNDEGLAVLDALSKEPDLSGDPVLASRVQALREALMDSR